MARVGVARVGVARVGVARVGVGVVSIMYTCGCIMWFLTWDGFGTQTVCIVCV